MLGFAALTPTYAGRRGSGCGFTQLPPSHPPFALSVAAQRRSRRGAGARLRLRDCGATLSPNGYRDAVPSSLAPSTVRPERSGAAAKSKGAGAGLRLRSCGATLSPNGYRDAAPRPLAPSTVRPERSRVAAKSKGVWRKASTSLLRRYAQAERLSGRWGKLYEVLNALPT